MLVVGTRDKPLVEMLGPRPTVFVHRFAVFQSGLGLNGGLLIMERP